MTLARRSFASRLGLAAIYTGVSVPMFAVWEVAQLPLYTIWQEQGARASLWAALHCTVNDALILFLIFSGAVASAAHVPGLRNLSGLAAMTLLSSLVATAVIEVLSTQWLERWSYGPLMPVEPVFAIGLSPLAQWLIVPASALFLLRRRLAQGLVPMTTAGVTP